MVYQPDPPFPKTRGNTIRSTDWNDTVNEVVRLDQAKLNSTGGTVSGNLTVAGNLSANGTISGNLAANTVGTNQLSNGSVTAAKLANSSINPDHVPVNVLPVDRLVGYYPQRNLALTIPALTSRGVFAGYSDSPACPLVFFAASSPDGVAIINYSVQYGYIFGDGGGHQVTFMNGGEYVAWVRVSIFLLFA